jgi:hypothetical protein
MTKTVEAIDFDNLEIQLINKFISDDLKYYTIENVIQNQLANNLNPAFFFDDNTIKSLMEFSWFKNRNDIILTTLNSIYNRMNIVNQNNKKNGISEYNSLPYKTFFDSYTHDSIDSFRVICDNVVSNPSNYSISTYDIGSLTYDYFIPELFSFGRNADIKAAGLLSNAIVGIDDNVVNIGDMGLHYENPYYSILLLQDIFSQQKLLSFNKRYITFLEKDAPYENLSEDFMLDINNYIENYVKKTSNYFEKDDNYRIRQYNLALISIENKLKDFLFSNYKSTYYNALFKYVSNENSTLVKEMQSENKKLMQNSNAAFGWS